MKWKITYVSPSIKRLLGYTVEEMMRLAITDILTPDSLKQASKFIRNQMDIMTPGSQHPSLSLTLEYVRKDGSTLWAEVMLSFLWDKDGKLSEVLGVTREITERKKAEEALRQSEQRYRMLAENVKDIIWIRDMNLRTTYVSPSATQMSGYSVEEVMSLSLEESMTPASLEVVKNAFSKVIAAEEGQRDLSAATVLEVELIHKDGSIVPVEMKVNFLRDPDGHPTGFLGVTRDITERKKAEEALRQSEQRYRLLAENVKDVIWTVDMNLRLTYTSPSITQLTGYPHEEYITKTLEEILTPASIEFVTNLFAEELALEDSGHSDLFRARTFEAELICKDGSIVPVEMKATALRDADGRPIGVLGVSRDISERKRAEEALRESQEELQAIFDNARDGIALFDLEGRLLKANKRVLEVGGYTTDEIAGKTFDLLTMFTPESIERMFTAKDMILSGKEVPVFECEACTKSGRKLNLEVHVSPFFLKGKRLGSVSIMRDITERKKTGDALKESEARFRTVFEGTGLGIALVDFNGKTLGVNPAFEQMLGYNMEEFAEIASTLKYLHPEDSMVDAELYLEMVKGKREHYTVDKRYIRKDGGVIWGRQNLSVVRDASGKPKYFIAMIEDITERRKMEETLKRSEHNYRVLFEGTIDGMFVTDIETVKVVLANQNAAKMCGFASAENAIGINPLDLIHPDDREQVLGFLMEDALGKSEQEVHEFRAITKDGREIWVSGMGTRIEYGGKPAVLSSIRDITERKKAEEVLRISEERYRLLVENASEAILVAQDGMLRFFNTRVIEILGYSREELASKPFIEFIHSEDQAMVVGRHMARLEGKEVPPVYSFRVVDKTGNVRWVDISAVAFTWEGRPATLNFLTDITERKRMEDEKQKMEEQLRLASRLAAVGELAAGVGHELNNPIAAIQGFAQFLAARKDLDETTRKDLDTIYRESQRAAKITQNLLSFARRHEPEKHLISLNEAVEKTLELQAHPMKVNNIELVVELAPDLPKTLADFHQMQQVFVNIINNAEQAMGEAHGKGRLVVKTQKVRDMIQISFVDDGPGISEENIKRIFDPFFTTKEVGKGTGLGLSICYGLVEAHGGRIYARSKLGQGATFVVEIPIVFEDQLVAEAALINPGSRGVKWKKPKG